MPDIPDLEIGKAAEYLVVADLILQGYRAYLTDQGLPYDVVVDVGGRLIRLQVKATRGLRAIPQRAVAMKGYLFHPRRAGKAGSRSYGKAEFDILALVALDIRTVAYMPITDSVKQTIILRAPGHRPAKHATRAENIDQLPFWRAFEDFTGEKAVHAESGRTFNELSQGRVQEAA